MNVTSEAAGHFARQFIDQCMWLRGFRRRDVLGTSDAHQARLDIQNMIERYQNLYDDYCERGACPMACAQRIQNLAWDSMGRDD